MKITKCHDGHILLESELKCTTCQRYKEFYAYGCTEAGIQFETGQWLTWQWNATTCVQDMGMINMKIEWIATVVRKDWLRQQNNDLKNYEI